MLTPFRHENKFYIIISCIGYVNSVVNETKQNQMISDREKKPKKKKK